MLQIGERAACVCGQRSRTGLPKIEGAILGRLESARRARLIVLAVRDAIGSARVRLDPLDKAAARCGVTAEDRTRIGECRVVLAERALPNGTAFAAIDAAMRLEVVDIVAAALPAIAGEIELGAESEAVECAVRHKPP